MFKITIIAVGRLRDRSLAALAGEYVKRLGRYCSISVIEVAEENITARASEADIQKFLSLEAERIIGKLRPGAFNIALDVNGDSIDSIEFAESIGALTTKVPEAVFIIGGSHGLHFDVLAVSRYRLSLSSMTFPHLLARVILLEQLYRAFKIYNHETYHK